MNDSVSSLLNTFDIICISETHFGVRSKALLNFTLISRSKKIESKSPRGGVALYKNNSCSIDVEIIYDGFRDCVVCRIKNTDVILVAMYIPPSNSKYFEESYFLNLELISSMFASYQLIILGDLNCRVGTPQAPHNRNYTYIDNPDTTINPSGSRLNKWIVGKNLLILNGLTSESKRFDSNFTFFRGDTRSQNDLVMSNAISIVESLTIMEKDIYSDHSPISIVISVSPSCPLSFLQGCAQGLFSDDHWDINKRKIPSLVFSKIDWPNAIQDLENISASIMESIQDTSLSNDHIVAMVTSTIYDTCKNNYKKPMSENSTPSHNPNCKSANLKAIANMNFFTYNHHTDNGEDMTVRKPYLEYYVLYEKLALEAADNEVNAKKNSAWKKSKGDGKAMWKLIDWKGSADTKKDILIQESDITPYFKNIFQSDKTKHHPKVDTVLAELNTYNTYVAALDDPFRYDELTLAVSKVGGGCGLDGIRSSVMKMVPPSLLQCILRILQRVFVGDYPTQWEVQILNAVAKDGHCSKDPKLRGIGIAVLLARVYDIVLDERFKCWYVPNPEQAGFRTGQGCPLPLFSIFLLLHYAAQNQKEICIGFMDYEKAFDYANRAKIVMKLMDKGCGRVFTEAITKMFHSTTYIPSTNNKLCEPITTSYGVAQGRNSSPNIYSFSVSDMASSTNSLEEKDFVDPHNLAQLADDTAVLADGTVMVGNKMKCLLDYSDEIYQIPNIPKTVYCHFAERPFTGKLRIDENTELSSVDLIRGHRYLGVKFLPTNNVEQIIIFNIDDKSQNWCKFYAWLEVNEETPIEIKLLVLDACLLSVILYAVEVLGDMSCVEKKLRLAEQKALRAILQVKKGTTIELLYNEIKRPDVMSVIKDSQYKFFQKVKGLKKEEAVVVSILELCKDTPFVHYYESLLPDNRKRNIHEREIRIRNSESSMTQYYSSIVNVETKSNIYTSLVDDRSRRIITRWRLSNHKLRIETGRYQVPFVQRVDRKCYICDVVEDENHALYHCPSFAFFRCNFTNLLEKYPSIGLLLNPEPADIYEVASLLSEIDDVLSKR